MGTRFEDSLSSIDERADQIVGDTIQYKVGASPAVEVLGFIRSYGEDEHDFAPLQGGKVKFRCKIAKRLVPAKPDSTVRVTASMLTGNYRPSSDSVSQDGRYWVFDLEKAA